MIAHLGAELDDGLYGVETGLKPPGYQLFVIGDSIGEVHQVSSVVFRVFTSCSNKADEVFMDRVRKIKKALNGR